MKSPIISIIVAMDEKRGIGKAGGIPWKIPGEQKRFKEITTPHPMIMGRKTFESIGRILPNRPHIIVTRDSDYKVEGAAVVNSLEKALEEAKTLDNEEIFIIGGGQIYKQSIDLADRLYLTVVEGDYSADTFFPEYPQFTKEIENEDLDAEGTRITLLTLEKP